MKIQDSPGTILLLSFDGNVFYIQTAPFNITDLSDGIIAILASMS